MALILRDRDEGGAVLPGVLAIGRREELVLLTVEADGFSLPFELVVGDVDALLRELTAPTSQPIALLLRSRDIDSMPLIAAGYLAVSVEDEVKMMLVRSLPAPHAPFELAIKDELELVRQLRAIKPPSARHVGLIVREG